MSSNMPSIAQSLTQLELCRFQEQEWPESGACVLAQSDLESVVVYQAYKKEISEFAVAHQHFGGEAFSFNRMSWVKPNFTWMMYRCGWALKPNQERVLAIRLKREFFDGLLRDAVHSTYHESYGTKEQWRKHLTASDVIVQWDPDHAPFTNHKCTRRAIQPGIRPRRLVEFRGPAIVSIEDITEFVNYLYTTCSSETITELWTPKESEYYPVDDSILKRLVLD